MINEWEEFKKELVFNNMEEINMIKRGFEKISISQIEEDFNGYDRKSSNRRKAEIKMPQRATSQSAGYDIKSPISFKLEPNEEIKLPTGLKAYMQSDEALFAYPRGGLGFKYYCRLANTIGVIDSDYYNNESNEGHIWVKIRNEGDRVITIEQGDSICQVIFQKYLLVDGDNFEGELRKGGFGSTG